MNEAADLLVLGGGPAGSAAGIAALLRGRKTIIVETADGPDSGPGETLHPGATAIFRKLGVLGEIEAACDIRPQAHKIMSGAGPVRQAYGEDRGDPWRGFQILKTRLNKILLARFEELGGELRRARGGGRPIVDRGTVLGLETGRRLFEAPLTIDASGRSGAIRRALSINLRRMSPPLVAHFGYRRGYLSQEPLMTMDSAGWSWTAQVGKDLVAWTRLCFEARKGRLPPPPPIERMPDAGGGGALDVSWRIADRLTGPGFMLAGDSGVRLDPAASNGMLRGMMSGMMASHQAADAASGKLSPGAAAASYDRWLSAWFHRDASAMLDLYARSGAPWAQALTHPAYQGQIHA